MDKFGFGYDLYRRCQVYKMNLIKQYIYIYILANRDLKCIKTYRKANYHFKKNHKIRHLYYEIKLKRLCYKYDFNVPSSTSIGKGLFIGHNGPIIINNEAIIGDNCNIATGVTIGRENRGKRFGCPTIGNRVWIGTNSTIVGKITIGDNVLIAPNSYINFDVPSNSIVVDGKIIKKENATESYICYTI